MLGNVDPDLGQLIIAIVGAVLAFFGAKQGGRRRD